VSRPFARWKKTDSGAILAAVSANSPNEQRDVLFHGRVQGVGFRFTTREVAARFQVTGYVQNLPDGRVRLVAEGEPAELDRFMQAVEAELARHIHGSESTTSPATGAFSCFEIRH
jgi:acylphosphatase